MLGSSSILAAAFPELYERLFGRSGNDHRLANAERQLRVEDLLALAVLADGRVTDEEWAALERLGDPDAVLTWRRRAVDVTDRGELLRIARALAEPLSERERRAALRLVVQLVEAGAGLSDREVGLREAARSDGRALLEVFREALEIDGPG